MRLLKAALFYFSVLLEGCRVFSLKSLCCRYFWWSGSAYFAGFLFVTIGMRKSANAFYISALYVKPLKCYGNVIIMGLKYEEMYGNIYNME